MNKKVKFLDEKKNFEKHKYVHNELENFKLRYHLFSKSEYHHRANTGPTFKRHKSFGGHFRAIWSQSRYFHGSPTIRLLQGNAYIFCKNVIIVLKKGKKNIRRHCNLFSPFRILIKKSRGIATHEWNLLYVKMAASLWLLNVSSKHKLLYVLHLSSPSNRQLLLYSAGTTQYMCTLQNPRIRGLTKVFVQTRMREDQKKRLSVL